ncbi:aminotransferase class I/II-fold pyridoxal phosphate-dependent enzyme [Pelagibacteraceae bacterium]|nr:aminotransferase class I/II-fold pyridoxal phosphate-dependent enzyme [Pelagibacteraceae bacterium]
MKSKFERINRLPPYIFSEINNLKFKLRSKKKDIIDFGMGNPDMPTPNHIRQKLKDTIDKPGVGRYSVSKGINGLRKAQAKYYRRRFNVHLNINKEIIVTIGSKEGLANLAQAITSKGDKILCPDPSYPVHPYGFTIAGAKLISLKTIYNGNFNPKKYLINIERNVKKNSKIKAVIVSFPSNPTAQTVNIDFYKDLVKLAKKNDIYILSDLAYSEIYFENNPPPSILEVNGAKKVAVEFTTLSKTYAMAGWRIGFAVGNNTLIEALTKIKSYVDYGAFTPVQVAATAALNGPQQCVEDIRQIYKKRRDVLIESFGRAGWNIPKPKASMFVWAPIPDKFKKLGSMKFSKKLMINANVAVAPGLAFGKNGEGFVRIGLVENTQRIRQAAKNIKKFLV